MPTAPDRALAGEGLAAGPDIDRQAASPGTGHPGASWGVVALLALASMAGCDRFGKQVPAPEPAESRPASGAAVAVRLARVDVGRAPRIVRAMGSFEAREVVTIGAKVSGRIVGVGPDVGDRVERGAELARIEDVDYVLARDQRQRALEESLAKLGLSSLPEGEIDFEQLPVVERARLEAANAKSRYDRGLPLHARTPPLISDQDLADLKVAWDVAMSAQKGALLSVRAELAQARTRMTELLAAEQRLRDTRYVAPDGSPAWLVAARPAAAGNYVGVGTPLYRLVDADPLRLVVRVPERRMAGVVPGKPASVSVSESAPPIACRVTRIRPEVDPRTRTHEVEIEVGNPDFALSVGGFAIAEILVGEDDAVPMIASAAVVTFAGVRKVFVPEGATAVQRLVVTGRTVAGRVEVIDGLAPGDAYVLDPPPTLVPGARIRVEDGSSDAEAR